MTDEKQPSWTIVFYKDRNDKLPVKEFIDSLSKNARATVSRDIDLLKKFGVLVGAPTVRPITSIRKLWELRSKTNDGAIRIFYVAVSGRRFVLLHSFIKKTDKTPQPELDIAKKRLNEVLAKEDKQNG